MYIVQSFTLKRGHLVGDLAFRCRSVDHALRSAERLTETKAGVVAWEWSRDPATDQWRQTMLFRAGDLPEMPGKPTT